MAERKVLIKYYPPDFDPEKLAVKCNLLKKANRVKRPRNATKQLNVRFMFPFTLCCATCAEFIYIGTKFNSRVEKIQGDDYLGIPIWRFYGRCPHCRASIIFKTDPKNTEYVLESGGTRTYDSRKDAELAESSLKQQREKAADEDSMVALEQKSHSTAKALQALEQLDELRRINKRFLHREEAEEEVLRWLQSGGVTDRGLENDHEGSSSNAQPADDLTAEELEELKAAKLEMQRLRRQRIGSSTPLVLPSLRPLGTSSVVAATATSSSSSSSSSSDSEA